MIGLKKASGRWVDYNVLRIIKRANLQGPTILDVGCSDGGYLKLMAKKFGSNKVVGLDIDEIKIKEISTIRASAFMLPFRENSFHSIFMKDVLHHVLDHKKVIAELCRVAVKEVIIVEANIDNWFMGNPTLIDLKKHPHFTPDRLEKIMADIVGNNNYTTTFLEAYPFGTNQKRVLKIFNYFPFLLPVAGMILNLRENNKAAFIIMKINPIGVKVSSIEN